MHDKSDWFLSSTLCFGLFLGLHSRESHSSKALQDERFLSSTLCFDLFLGLRSRNCCSFIQDDFLKIFFLSTKSSYCLGTGTLCTFIMLKFIVKVLEMVIPCLCHFLVDERGIFQQVKHLTTTSPFCSTTAITLLGLCDSFTMLSLQGDSAVEFENKVVAVMSSRSFSEGSNIKTVVHSVCSFVMTL